MALDDDFHAYVLDRLKLVAPVTSKRFFGGRGIWSDDHFFAMVMGDRLYLKVNDANRPDYEEAGSTPFAYGDPPKSVNLWALPAGILDDPDTLAVWVEKSIAAARSKKKR